MWPRTPFSSAIQTAGQRSPHPRRLLSYYRKAVSTLLINTLIAPPRSKYVGMDTETHTFVDGVILPAEKIEAMMWETVKNEKGETVPKYPAEWWREHVTVTAWAYIIYCPEGYAILESFDEYSRFCAQFRIKTAWWYNAPFDFSILDAAKLSGGWTYTEDRRPTQLCQYTELASPFGARYSMTERHPINADASFAKRPTAKGQNVTHYDLRNLLKGGLAELLEKFDVRDADGVPVRKGSMNYQAAGRDNLKLPDLDYMIDDARGLWWLVDTFGKILFEKYGLDIRGTRPDVMTASGLAKILLLRKMYPNLRSDSGRRKAYRKSHPITVDLDDYYRRHYLLQGGLVMINPRIRGQPLGGDGFTLWRYDFNSRYPATMHDAPDIIGRPRIYNERCAKDAPDDVRVFEISELHAILRRGFIPTWLDPINHSVAAELNIYEWHTGSIMIFDFELDELEKWYHIDFCKVSRTWLFNGKPCPAFAEFVDEHYNAKAAAEADHNKVFKELEKVILNGVTGKFSQNPNHCHQWRQLDADGIVRLARGEKQEADESSLMNIVQGAYILAHARCELRRAARRIAVEAGKTVAEVIYYTDTDSLHTTEPYSQIDRYKLGWLKQENDLPIKEAIFMAPKTYAEIETDGTITAHCKGVRVELITEAYKRGETLAEIYRVGREYASLCAINVKGGKALLPLRKAVCRTLPDAPDENELYY